MCQILGEIVNIRDFDGTLSSLPASAPSTCFEKLRTAFRYWIQQEHGGGNGDLFQVIIAEGLAGVVTGLIPLNSNRPGPHIC